MLHGRSEVWTALVRDGYALTDDEEVGLATKFRENFAQTYFTDRVLRHDPGDWPVDRQRARDVVRYLWHGDKLTLREHEEITITDRAGIPGKRDHARVMLLNDPQAEELVHAFLSLYVLDRVGEGAESYLYREADVPSGGHPNAKTIFRHQLAPGQILIFED